MKEGSQNTAVLIFSRTEEDEAIHKQFVPIHFKSKNIKIAKTLIQSTLRTVKKTGLPFFIIDSDNQTGSCFGEKFSNAINTIFKKGFDNVITLGNDCPNLSVGNILTAADNLHKKKPSLGPANDGGIYLLALNKASFDFDRFKNFKWQTESLFNSLEEFLNNIGKSATILSTKADIDSYGDLISYLTASPKGNLKEVIRSILYSSDNKLQTNYSLSKKTSFALQSFGLRAPPIAA